MTAIIQCGDWGCNRDGKVVYADATIPETKDEAERREAARRSIRCGIHAGAEKRRRWGARPSFIPLAERADIRMLAQAYYDKVREQRIKAAEAQRIEARKRGVERFLEEWDLYLSDSEDKYGITNTTDDAYRVRRSVRNVSVGTGGRRSFEQVIATEDNSRYEDLPYPLYLRLPSGQSMTPAEARNFAKALNLMADRVEAANNLLIANGIENTVSHAKAEIGQED